MFFWITWGSSSKEQMLGVVADYCPRCRRVRRHAVLEYSRVSHVYFIPLGEGTPIAEGRQCYRCDEIWECDTRDYDEMLDEDVGLRMSLGRLLEVTNSRLIDDLERAGRAEYLPPAPVRTKAAVEYKPRKLDTSRADPEMSALIAKLSNYIDFDRKAVQLKQTLRNWDRMTAEERTEHVEIVEEYVAEQQRLSELGKIAGDLTSTIPRHHLGALFAFLFAALALSAIWLIPLEWPSIALVGYGVGVVTIAWVIFGRLVKARNHRWVRSTLIPALQQAGHNPAAVHRYLSRLENRSGSSNRKLGQLAKMNSTLGSALKTQLKLGMHPEEVVKPLDRSTRSDPIL